MRKLDLSGSPEKRPRGLRRKLEGMRREARRATEAFPAPREEYWHFHLPVEQAVSDSRNAPFGVRRACALALLDGARRLVERRPEELAGARVAALVALPAMWWESQIVVFFDEWYFSAFFHRDNRYQRWEELPPSAGIVVPWGLGKIEGFVERSFRATEWDEDGSASVSELHYIGELGPTPIVQPDRGAAAGGARR